MPEGGRLAAPRQPARGRAALLDAAPESLALRASIVIGARSRSFRFLVRLVERMPVLPLPAWRDHRTQPIDGRDVLAFLVAARAAEHAHGRLSLDIAGPDVLTYGELVERIRDALLSAARRAPRLHLTPVASRVAAAIAGEDPRARRPADGGPRRRPAAARRPRRRAARRPPAPLDAAIERALRDWEAVEELAAR